MIIERRLEDLTNKQTKKAIQWFQTETFFVIMISFLINMAIIGSFTNMDLSSIDGDKFNFITCGELL